MFKKVLQNFTKKKLKIDNYGQNLQDPYSYHKSIQKLKSIDPKYESILQEPHFQKLANYRKEYLINLKKWPDDNEVLIDIDKFNFFEYIKFLFKSKFDDLEEKDQFPYRALQIIIIFIVIEGLINLQYYTCKDVYKEYQKEEIKPHYNYKNLENELRYSILLFNRSVN
ncbi:unnamed protein product [Paramecium sonneborni]|uniref:Uncharacterized protein n=1 Tax=Paramecium sonneborni TaxID=65129 RepID=A0A8S1L049_9CILI|nr:unnamed protein product [Paramecium sonneborni]